MRRLGLSPDGAAGNASNKPTRGHSITATSSQAMKAMRGTKRVCLECATRFYDLSRDPIVCPSCGAQHAPTDPAPVTEARAGFSDKASWRSRRSKQPSVAESAPQSHESEPADADAEDGPDEEAPSPSDDTVLEEDPDDTDISGLLHHHDTEPTER